MVDQVFKIETLLESIKNKKLDQIDINIIDELKKRTTIQSIDSETKYKQIETELKSIDVLELEYVLDELIELKKQTKDDTQIDLFVGAYKKDIIPSLGLLDTLIKKIENIIFEKRITITSSVLSSAGLSLLLILFALKYKKESRLIREFNAIKDISNEKKLSAFIHKALDDLSVSELTQLEQCLDESKTISFRLLKKQILKTAIKVISKTYKDEQNDEKVLVQENSDQNIDLAERGKFKSDSDDDEDEAKDNSLALRPIHTNEVTLESSEHGDELPYLDRLVVSEIDLKEMKFILKNYKISHHHSEFANMIKKFQEQTNSLLSSKDLEYFNELSQLNQEKNRLKWNQAKIDLLKTKQFKSEIEHLMNNQVTQQDTTYLIDEVFGDSIKHDLPEDRH